MDLLQLDPVPALLARVRAELAADFGAGRAVRLSRAPGRLDVMGGIADYTGSLVCELPLDRAAAVAVGERDDRQVQVFSFNLFDQHKPFTLRVPLDALAWDNLPALRRGFEEPGRRWAAYLAGCLPVLHAAGVLDPRAMPRGLNVALYSTVPLGAGVSSSAAIEVATMMNLLAHAAAGGAGGGGGDAMTAAAALGPMDVAALCQRVENEVVGAPCGIMDQATSVAGEAGKLFRMVCQPHEVLPPLTLPAGVRVVGINSNVRHSVGGNPADTSAGAPGQYGRTRCAAFMGHRIILDRMREMGRAAGRELTGDPTHGYLANLDPDDYKRFFRPHVPERLTGRAFLDRHGPTADPATTVEPDVDYAVQHAVDHHVLEARRVRNFVRFLEKAGAHPPGSRERRLPLDKAGHLMYASHLSYTNDAMLGAPGCDLLVALVRRREPAGLYGARITGGGGGGTVAVLCDAGGRADAAVGEVMAEYERQTGQKPEALAGTSPGAWGVGTQFN